MDDQRALIAACESEAIHSPGSIQPWGAMLIADEHDLTVRHASANLHAYLGVAGADALGLKLADLVGEGPASDMLAGAAIDASSGVTLWLPPQAPGLPRLAVSCLRTEGALYLELERDVPLVIGQAFAGLRSRDIVAALTATGSKDELFAVAMARLRRVLGFDRVLTYRFHEDGHGEVLFDDHAPDMEKLLGLHFPSEDIPPPAWRIFARLGVRVIGDSHAAPVPLLGDVNRPPNLALTALRSPSACHMEYLRNMGSHATATVPLTVDGTLWGLLAGHHRAAAHVPAPRRALCELIGQIAALKLANLRDVEVRCSARRRHAQLNGIANGLSEHDGDPAQLAAALAGESTALLSLCDADGAILRLGGKLACCGRAPEPESAASLLDALLAHETSELACHAVQYQESLRDNASFSFDELGAVLGITAHQHDVAGALVLKLSHGNGDAIAWLRPEHASEVKWGGDPRLSVSRDLDNGRLVPRASFALWREELRGRCKPWDEEAHRSASGLRSTIEQLTAGYAETMRAAREAAERSTRAKSEFLATMSHEIRSPMSGLLGVLELLRATKLDAEQAGMAGMIHNSASMLLAVLNDILDFSKIEAGALSITLEPVGLRALLSALVQPHSIAAARKGLAAHVIIGPEVPDRVLTDRLRLSQILGNLISNALKFTGAGEISLQVDRQPDAAGEKLRFTVSDTGIGMSDAVIGRLFAPFMQADGSTTRNFGGTGLGLCISRQLARLLGGDLSAASKLGEGSAFTLVVPLEICAAEADEIVPPGQQPDLGLADRARRVLVVDDDPTIRWLSQRQLLKLGIEADSADDGESGLGKLRDAAYDLVLTDCHMPRMDGVALTRAVRAMSDPKKAALPIIGLTADVTEAQRNLCGQAGMNELAIKPLTVERLGQLLHRHLPATEPHCAPSQDAAPELRAVPFDDQIYLSIFDRCDADGAQWLHDWRAAARRDAGEMTSLLDQAAADFDRNALRLMAHRLAGASFSVGAMKLGETAREMENAASDAALAGLRACQDKVRQELADSEAAMFAFLAG